MFGLLLFDFFLSLNLRPSYPPLYPPDMTSFPTAIVHGESIDLNETNGHQGREGRRDGRTSQKKKRAKNQLNISSYNSQPFSFSFSFTFVRP